MTHIGMIGIGMMGHGIASNLLKHGHHLTVLEHPGNQPLDALLAAGAQKCSTPQALAAQTDVIILCVTGTPQVEAVLAGPGGLLEAPAPGLIVVDCSTSEPESTQRLRALALQRGAELVDAPLARTPVEAEAGRLNVMVGAEPATFARVEPVLRCFAENVFHVGGPGAGHTIKLLNNFIAQAICTATAASTAEPPYLSTSQPGLDASGLAVTTMYLEVCRAFLPRR
jgi:3-hydroxyisobutyrate dehydrogenase-like beta-hydroxyacid dehydrogenase